MEWFEAAVEAVINGDAALLSELLREHPELVTARSARVTKLHPPVHRATLLHYIAANGVEEPRQRTPENAVEIAKLLLNAGAEPDALADMYGAPRTTLSMLVSSTPPATAGLQVALVEALVDAGASVETQTPLMTALAFGFGDTARALVRRGAKVDNLAAAAGLGMAELTARLLPDSDHPARHQALALAAQHGHAEAVRLLLDAGEDPNRFNPEGFHSHSTPLHQAALAGHAAVVRLLLARGARPGTEDKVWKSTAAGWARHGGRTEILAILRAERKPD